MEQAQALLPNGFVDLLPKEAALKHYITNSLQNCFASYGYDLTQPPILEFEDSLFADSGKALATNTFRIMDPISHKMMGIRSDMTMQIARIAKARLESAALPIRLSYIGDVLRVRGKDLYKERQLTQAGIELIGVENFHADVEVIRIALDSLTKIGVEGLSIDFTLPQLAEMLFSAWDIDENTANSLRDALSKKDIAAITELSASYSNDLVKLVETGIEPEKVLEILSSLALPDEAKDLCRTLADILTAVGELFPNCSVTIDPIDIDESDYHQGIGFTLYSSQSKTPIGRGGRYKLDNEEGVGFTLYVNALFRILPITDAKKRIFIPLDADNDVTQKLQQEGFITLHATSSENNIEENAKAHHCTHIYKDNAVKEI